MTEKQTTKSCAADLPAKLVEPSFPMKVDKIPAMDKIVGALGSQGIAKTHLSQAIAIIIGLLSSKLGDPVPMVITEDEGAGALELLLTCLNLVPADSWTQEPTGKAMKSSEISFDGKTVFCYEADSEKCMFLKLLMDIELSGNIDQTKKRSSFKAPVSFVTLTKNPTNPLLENRYVTRIHVNPDHKSKQGRLANLLSKSDYGSQRHSKVECACVRKLLGRVSAILVDIDFAEQMINPDATRFQNIVPFAESIFKIIRNITLINNVPQLYPEELQAAFVGLDVEDLISDGETGERVSIKATQIDYAHFLTIFGGIFNVSSDFLTPRQLSIYNVIFSQNIEHQQKFMGNKNQTIQVGQKNE